MCEPRYPSFLAILEQLAPTDRERGVKLKVSKKTIARLRRQYTTGDIPSPVDYLTPEMHRALAVDKENPCICSEAQP
jgi:translation elongation factor EF-Tu-like GTPase